MKPFNIEKAKAGAEVCTRDGRKARVICFDKVNPSGDYARFSIIALVMEFDGCEAIYTYDQTGTYNCSRHESVDDLMLAGERHDGWVNVYRTKRGGIIFSEVYEEKEIALAAKRLTSGAYADTIKIEWRE